MCASLLSSVASGSSFSQMSDPPTLQAQLPAALPGVFMRALLSKRIMSCKAHSNQCLRLGPDMLAVCRQCISRARLNKSGSHNSKSWQAGLQAAPTSILATLNAGMQQQPKPL
eukprot:GHRR01028637.1.p1 GENE.GHRR01028637.1~~GHRR01028637.1.p1  ORF type:complete len:113 (-),score=16.43 GHRR01028637.1:186-524(-)